MNMAEGKFPLGSIAATPGAIEVMQRMDPDENHSRVAARLLARHHSGDWGDLDDEDREQNEKALQYGYRLFSVYGQGQDRLYIITEHDRSQTTILTPGEY